MKFLPGSPFISIIHALQFLSLVHSIQKMKPDSFSSGAHKWMSTA